jgi:hypothetical protein
MSSHSSRKPLAEGGAERRFGASAFGSEAGENSRRPAEQVELDDVGLELLARLEARQAASVEAGAAPAAPVGFGRRTTSPG